MKKCLVMLVALMLSSLSIMAATQYLEKSIETESGAIATCWKIESIDLRLSENRALIRASGYKDAEAAKAGKTKLGYKEVWINDIASLQCYTGAFTEVLGKILQSEVFSGAELKLYE